MDFGVPLAEIAGSGAEALMVAPEEQVFRGFGLDDEIQFSILVSGSYVSVDSFANRDFPVAWLWAHLLDRFYPHQRVRGTWLPIRTYDPKPTRVSSSSAFPCFHDRKSSSCG